MEKINLNFFTDFYGKYRNKILLFSVLAVIVLSAVGLLLRTVYLYNEASTSKNVQIFIGSRILAGQPIRMVALVSVDEIKNGKHLVKIPKVATDINIKKITPEEIRILNENKEGQKITATQKLNPASLAIANAGGKNNQAKGFWRIFGNYAGSLLAAVEQVVIDTVSNIAVGDDSQLVDISSVVTPEPEVIVTSEQPSTPEIAPVEEVQPEQPVTPEITPVDEAPITEPVVEPEAAAEASSNDGATPVAPSCQGAETDNCVAVEYTLPAPEVTEQTTDTGKLVTISSTVETPDQPPLTDVLASTTIPEIFKVGQEDKIKIRWKNNGDQNVTFHAYDTEGDGYLDYVEWTVPHLSEQIFEIIFISKAFQLDENQNIISDIYDTVKTKDDVWVSITNGQYIRATFYKTLTSRNDNTIYARPTNLGSPVTIEVYPVYTDGDGNVTEGPLVATFENIDSEKTYRVLLTNLQTPTDVFDLKVIGNVDIDWVVDPSTTWTGAIDVNMDDVGNWSNGIPGSGDVALIYSSQSFYDPGSGTCNAGTVDVNNGFPIGGTWNGALSLTNESYITAGTYNGTVSLASGTQINGGTFYEFVTNAGTINNGNFCQTQAETGGTILGGTFNLGATDPLCYNYVAPDIVTGLVSHWKMNDNAATTTVVDNIGSNNGTAARNTSTTHVVSGNPPSLNGALSFNGSSDYVAITNSLGLDTVLSVSIWVKFTSSGSEEFIIIPNAAGGWTLFKNSSNYIYFGNFGYSDELISSTTITDTNWHHIAVSYNSTGTSYLYIDNVEVATTTNNGSYDSTKYHFIGGNSSWWFDGSIDDVRVYNRVLTSVDVSALYNSGSGTEEDGNTAPSATITTPGTWNAGDVTITYKIIDAQSNTSNISQTATSGIEYSLDNSTWVDATKGTGGDNMTGLTSSASPGTEHTFVWASATDLGTTSDSTVYIRVRPNDGTVDAEAWATSDAFGIDNVAPASPDACDGTATDADCWSIEASDKAWGPWGVTSVTGTTDGAANTVTLAALGSSYVAAYYCDQLLEGGYTNWFLPAYDQLAAGRGSLGAGGFPNGYYWSSTENSENPNGSAWCFNGGWGSSNKTFLRPIRCLRSSNLNVILAPTFGTITTSSIVVNQPTATDSGSGVTHWMVRRGGSTESDWIAVGTTTYTSDTLSANTQYTYDVRFKDTAGNISAYGTTAAKYTLANTPAAPTVNTPAPTTINVNPVTGGAETAMAIYAEAGASCDGSAGLGYVQVNGSISASAVWQADATWGTKTVTGLSEGTQYSFCVKARNGDTTETAFGTAASETTTVSNTPPSATFDNDFATWTAGDVTVNYNLIDADSDTLNISQTANSGIEYSTDNSTWYDATEKTGGLSEGLTNLSGLPTPGASHVFIWDSATDLPTTEDSTVYLRVRPNDGTANAVAWATSDAFGLDNVAPFGDACDGTATDADCWSITATGKTWGPNPSTTGVSTDTVLSNGKANTAILYALSHTDYAAADYCYTLTEGGVSAGTWYLPSYAELEAAWAALGSGGFPSGNYWSSTEFESDPTHASWMLPSGFLISPNNKDASDSVRCLRDTVVGGTIPAPTFGTITTSSIVVNQPTAIDLGSGLAYWKVGMVGWVESDWIAIGTTTYESGSLSANAQYTYNVAFKDVAGNISSYGSTASKYTLANAPSTPTVNNPQPTTIDVNPVTGGVETSMAIYAEQGATCDGAGGLGYVQANGSISASAVWQADGTWGTAGTVTVTGLSENTQYSFCVKARNGDTTETAFGTGASSTTTVSNVAPNAPTLVSPATASYTSDTTPTLSANYSDNDTGDVGTTNYRISTSSGTACVNNTNVIKYGASSPDTATNNETTSWTPTAITDGDATYYWCAQNNDGTLTSSWTYMGSFVLDTTAPVLTEVTSVATPSTNATPSYTFHSTEVGTVNYSGSCSSATSVAIAGDNTITFNALLTGTYSNCAVIVIDLAGNYSSALNVTAFTITSGGGGDEGGSVTCTTDSECGTGSYIDSPICQDGNVYQNYKTWTCNNPGTTSSSCTSATASKLKTACLINQLCVTGACVDQTIACATNAACGTDEFSGSPFCSDGNVYQNYKTYICNNPGTVGASCSNSTTAQLKTTCLSNQTCASGVCVNRPAICVVDSDCGAGTKYGSLFCRDGAVQQNYTVNSCNKPGTEDSSCSSALVERVETVCTSDQVCDSGSCVNQNNTHNECNGSQCLSVSGVGINKCNSDGDCITPKHNECNLQQCVTLDGTGSDQCQTSSDCAGGAGSGTGGQTFESHSVCADEKCVFVEGAGSDQCQTDSNCVSVIAKTIDTITKAVEEQIPEPIKVAVAQTKQAVESPEGSVVTKAVSTTGVVVATAAVASSLSFSFFEIFLVPIRLFGLLLTALGIRKRFHPWGVVYDSVTKQPLDPAYVVLKNAKGQEVASAITDLDGRYGFLVAPGVYQIQARKTNYAFPSEKLAGKAFDELYSDLYFGEAITVKTLGEAIVKNIPLDPVKFDWNEFAKKDKKLMKFYSKWDVVLRKIYDLIFIIGFIVAVVAYIFVPQPYNAVVIMLYLFLLLLRIFGVKPKAYGYVVDKDTGNPLSFAIMRVMMPGINVEINHQIIDKFGRYYCLVPKGQYYVKIDKKNDDGSYSSAYTSQNIYVSHQGIIKEKFKV